MSSSTSCRRSSLVLGGAEQAVWLARLWRRVSAAPRVPWPERRWEWERLPPGHPDGRYRMVGEDETRRLLRELDETLEGAAGDLGPALAAFDALGAHVGMEPRPL